MRLNRVLITIAATGSILAGCASVEAENNLTGDFLAGRFAERRNSVEGAADAYAKALAHAPQHVGILRDAFFYKLAAGEVDDAADYARKLMAIGEAEDDGLARLTLAAEALKGGRLKPARAALVGAMDARFLKSIAYLTDVWIEAGISGPGPAIDKLDNPGPDVFAGFNALHKALLSEEAGRFDEARAAFEASAFALGDPVGRAAYGPYLERRGDVAAAREYYTLMAGEPGPMRRAAEHGLKRLDRGAPLQGSNHATPADGAAYAFYAFAGALVQQAAGERMRAEEAGFVVGEPRFSYPLALARLALYLKPDFAEARRLVGTILNIYGEPDAAIAVLREIPAASPHFEQARIEIAAALMAKGEQEEAVRVLREAIRRDRGAVEARWTLATIYASDGKNELAVKMLDAVIEELPARPDADVWRYFVSRAAALIELGRWEKAEIDLKRAVEIAPEEPNALNYLGYSWAERGVNLEEAFELIEKAVSLRPDSGAIVDSLGWAHYQLGHYEEALANLEKAAALEPSDPTITEHLGDVYWRLGRRIEARYQWRRSLELDPGAARETAIREKLESGLPAQESAGERGEE